MCGHTGELVANKIEGWEGGKLYQTQRKAIATTYTKQRYEWQPAGPTFLEKVKKKACWPSFVSD